MKDLVFILSGKDGSYNVLYPIPFGLSYKRWKTQLFLQKVSLYIRHYNKMTGKAYQTNKYSESILKWIKKTDINIEKGGDQRYNE